MPIRITYDDLLARVHALAAATDRILVVGISGHGGAGKSTLAQVLAVELGLDPGQVVSTDWLKATTYGPGAGMWEQHDWLGVEAVVTSARAGAARLRFGYRWSTGETGVVDHPMPRVLLVEGIRLFSDRTCQWFDLAVWIDMDPASAGVRAKARNLEQGDDQAELDLWDTKWIPEGWEYELVERPHGRADVVVAPDAVRPVVRTRGTTTQVR